MKGKKLQLNKEVIAVLNDDSMNQVKGGAVNKYTVHPDTKGSGRMCNTNLCPGNPKKTTVGTTKLGDVFYE